MRAWRETAERAARARKSLFSDSFLDELPAGQYAALCSWRLFSGVKDSDMLSFVTVHRSRANRAFRALEILGAAEYLALLREVEAVFPEKKFPQYAEEIMETIGKQPADYFNKMGEKLVTSKGMKRKLWEYAFEYIAGHPEEFCATP